MAEKESFHTAMGKLMEQWKDQIEKESKKIGACRAKAEELEGEAKLQYLEQIKEIEKKVERLKARITEK